MDLKTWIKIAGLRQKAVAKHLGLSQSYFSELLCGKKRVPLELASRIEEYTKGEISRLQLLYPTKTSDSLNQNTNLTAMTDLPNSPLPPDLRIAALREAGLYE
jgi:DNA-binding transcriptional regulator YdaS (Cro superfamily)